jgi:ATP-dependent helicase HepA
MVSSDDDDSLDLFMNRTLETLGILVETKAPRIVFIKPNPESPFHFELVPKEGMSFAYHRAAACTREDAHFLTWDHPFVAQAIDRLLVTAIGNTAYVVWEDERAQIVLIEGIYLATPRSSAHDHLVARYMPPTPVRVVISHEFEDMSSEYTSEVVNKMVRNGRREWIRNNARPLHNILPGMMRNLNQRAEHRMRELAGKAALQMETILSADIARLKRLAETKRRKAEIKRIEEQIAATRPLFSAPMLVCDQLRLLRRGPSGKGI